MISPLEFLIGVAHRTRTIVVVSNAYPKSLTAAIAERLKSLNDCIQGAIDQPPRCVFHFKRVVCSVQPIEIGSELDNTIETHDRSFLVLTHFFGSSASLLSSACFHLHTCGNISRMAAYYPFLPSLRKRFAQEPPTIKPLERKGTGNPVALDVDSPVSVPDMAQSLRPCKPAKTVPRRSQKRPKLVRHSELFAMSAGRSATPPARTIRQPRRKLAETEKV